jgi:hypothetical protein
MDAQVKRNKCALRVQRWWRRHSRAPCLSRGKVYTYKVCCIFGCQWHEIRDVLDSLPRTRKDECIRIYRIYDKMCDGMPSIDDEEWSPRLPCLFADFVGLYRSIIKIVVTLKPSSEVLFLLRIMRMITLKLRRLGDVIQPHRGRAKLYDLLNCVSLTICQMQDVGRRVAETVRADAILANGSAILLQSFCRRQCALKVMVEARHPNYLSKYYDTLEDNYKKTLTFIEEAIAELSQPTDKKHKELFDKLQQFVTVLGHQIDLKVRQEGYSHLVLRLMMESDRVECFCKEYIQQKEQARVIRQQKRQEEANKLLKEQQMRVAILEKEKAATAARALARLEEDKMRTAQAEQKRLIKLQEIEEKEYLKKKEEEKEKEKEKAEKVRLALEKAALKEKMKAEKTANWQKGNK